MFKADKKFIEGIEKNFTHLLKKDAEKIISKKVFYYNKKLFHSGNRPCAAIDIKYNKKNQKLINDKIWIKKIDDSEKVFKKMEYVYKKLSTYCSKKNMPVPLHFDSKYNLIFTSRVFGCSLVMVTLKHLSVLTIRLPEWLISLYYDIGVWLRQFHMVTKKEKEVSFSTIKSELKMSIENNDYFETDEKELIKKHLIHIQNKIDPDLNLESVEPFNDFTLRNIIVEKQRNFKIIDWDAMIHPEFPQLAPIWNDITTFLLSIQSLIKLYPFISKNKIGFLMASFLKGYFKEHAISAKNHINDLFFIFTLRSFVGLSGDRPLYQIYRKRLSHRFVQILKEKLLKGDPFVTKLTFPSKKQSIGS